MSHNIPLIRIKSETDKNIVTSSKVEKSLRNKSIKLRSQTLNIETDSSLCLGVKCIQNKRKQLEELKMSAARKRTQIENISKQMLAFKVSHGKIQHKLELSRENLTATTEQAESTIKTWNSLGNQFNQRQYDILQDERVLLSTLASLRTLNERDKQTEAVRKQLNDAKLNDMRSELMKRESQNRTRMNKLSEIQDQYLRYKTIISGASKEIAKIGSSVRVSKLSANNKR